MPSPLFDPKIMEAEIVASNQRSSIVLPGETEPESRDEEALRFALDHLSLMAVEKERGDGGGMVDPLDGADSSPESCAVLAGSLGGLQMLERPSGSPRSSASCSPPEDYYYSALVEPGPRKRSINMTECVAVPSSEHVAEIVGRQGCKIKALRTKTNTYIKTPVRGEQPVFIVTGRREDVEMAKCEILSAAEHFSMIRASRCKAGGASAAGGLPGPPHLPGQTTIQVRVPYRVVGLVVGPKGATIKRIQQQTHTYIVTPSRDKDPVFEVTGMPENVDRAREEIETHITLRTGTFVDLQGDDFHNNGTDVSLEGLSTMGLVSALWSRANPPNNTPPPPPPLPLSVHQPSRKMASASFTSGGLGSDPYGGARGPQESSSPASPFSTGSGGFSFGGDPAPALPAADDLGFEFSTARIWRPFLNGAQKQRRNSSGPSGGAITPCLSPTLSVDPASLDHPLTRRVQSDPLSTLSWLQSVSSPSFSASSSSSSGGSSTGYSSSSSTGGSPTEPEGNVSAVGMLGLFKAGGTTEASKDCFVCCESEVTAALVPCGHKLFCMECAGQICQSSEPKCPVCHTPATQCIRVYS
ncbi:RNA-binding protein MEX3D [Arapaima gigas]